MAYPENIISFSEAREKRQKYGSLKIISLGVPEVQAEILKQAAIPVLPIQLETVVAREVIDGPNLRGFNNDKIVGINIHWLVQSGELEASHDYYLASGDNQRQLHLPFSDGNISA